jgi:hypothetical protein
LLLVVVLVGMLLTVMGHLAAAVRAVYLLDTLA